MASTNDITDDIVIFELQRMLDALIEYCDMRNLEVNLDKTKAMVFQNGGIVKCNEKWWCQRKTS